MEKSDYEPSLKRRRLTNKDRLAVITAVKDGASQAATAVRFGVSKACISGIMKHASDTETECTKFHYLLEKKTVKIISPFIFLDKPLLKWMEEQRAKNPEFMITGSVIRGKATRLYNEKKNLEETNFDVTIPSLFVASRGWLYNFLNRNNIRSYKITGEAASVNAASIESAMILVRDVICSFNPDCVFNLDETALFYQQTSNRSYVHCKGNRAGGKKSKNRITITLIASLEGEKLPIQVIGKSKQPRIFKKNPPDEHSLWYMSQDKAWQSEETFEQLVLKVNNIAEERSKSYLILLDNCSCHLSLCKKLDPGSSSHTCFKYKRLTFLYLPKNSTSITQPMDQGIIRLLKCKYQEKQIMNYFEFIEKDDTCNLSLTRFSDLGKVMKWIVSAWSEVPADTIQKCFVKSGCFAKGLITDQINTEENELNSLNNMDDIVVDMTAMQLGSICMQD